MAFSALAVVAFLVAVAQLERLVHAGGGPGGDCGAAPRAFSKYGLDFDDQVAV